MFRQTECPLHPFSPIMCHRESRSMRAWRSLQVGPTERLLRPRLGGVLAMTRERWSGNKTPGRKRAYYKTQAASVRLGFFGQNPAESGRVFNHGINSNKIRINPIAAITIIAAISHFAVCVFNAIHEMDIRIKLIPIIFFHLLSRCPAFLGRSSPHAGFFD